MHVFLGNINEADRRPINVEITPIASTNYLSIDYIMELHKEIERLKTEKLILLRNNLEHNQRYDELKWRQVDLEKSVFNARREMKLLKIGKQCTD